MTCAPPYPAKSLRSVYPARPHTRITSVDLTPPSIRGDHRRDLLGSHPERSLSRGRAENYNHVIFKKHLQLSLMLVSRSESREALDIPASTWHKGLSKRIATLLAYTAEGGFSKGAVRDSRPLPHMQITTPWSAVACDTDQGQGECRDPRPLSGELLSPPVRHSRSSFPHHISYGGAHGPVQHCGGAREAR